MVVHLVPRTIATTCCISRIYAILQVKDELARLPGVGNVHIFGAGDFSMRVWLDPDKFASHNLTADRRGQRHPRTKRAGRRGRPRRAADSTQVAPPFNFSSTRKDG